jgi:aminoglycoside phosphotransferase (APT) family kinase protein
MNQHDAKAHLVRRPEPQVLWRAMDTAYMRSALSAALGEEISELQVARTFFSASRPVSVLYKYRLRGLSEFSSLIGEVTGDETRFHFEGERRRLNRERCAQLREDDDTSFFMLRDPGVVIRKPGLDAKLPGLKLLLAEAFAVEFLAKLFDMPVTGSLAQVELKAQRLGKRAVLFAKLRNWRAGSRQAFIRLRPTTYEAGREAFDLHRRAAENLSGAHCVRVPEPIAFDPGLGAAVFSVLAGRAPELSGQGSAEDARLCGAALKELRELGPRKETVWTAEDEIEVLEHWRSQIGTYRPDLAPVLETALTKIARGLRRAPSVAPAICHRDFHEGQLLLSGASCGVLDFDTLCLADPALDIGNFSAHVRLSEMRGHGASSGFDASFIEAASAGLGESASRISIWRRAALLRLAAIYSFSSEPAHVIAGLIAEAAE